MSSGQWSVAGDRRHRRQSRAGEDFGSRLALGSRATPQIHTARGGWKTVCCLGLPLQAKIDFERRVMSFRHGLAPAQPVTSISPSFPSSPSSPSPRLLVSSSPRPQPGRWSRPQNICSHPRLAPNSIVSPPISACEHTAFGSLVVPVSGLGYMYSSVGTYMCSRHDRDPGLHTMVSVGRLAMPCRSTAHVSVRETLPYRCFLMTRPHKAAAISYQQSQAFQ